MRWNGPPSGSTPGPVCTSLSKAQGPRKATRAPLRSGLSRVTLPTFKIGPAEAYIMSKHTLNLNSRNFLKRVGAQKTTRESQDREAIYSQGNVADAMFCIQNGNVKLAVAPPRGKQAVIAIRMSSSSSTNGRPWIGVQGECQPACKSEWICRQAGRIRIIAKGGWNSYPRRGAPSVIFPRAGRSKKVSLIAAARSPGLDTFHGFELSCPIPHTARSPHLRFGGRGAGPGPRSRPASARCVRTGLRSRSSSTRRG